MRLVPTAWPEAIRAITIHQCRWYSASTAIENVSNARWARPEPEDEVADRSNRCRVQHEEPTPDPHHEPGEDHEAHHPELGGEPERGVVDDGVVAEREVTEADPDRGVLHEGGDGVVDDVKPTVDAVPTRRRAHQSVRLLRDEQHRAPHEHQAEQEEAPGCDVAAEEQERHQDDRHRAPRRAGQAHEEADDEDRQRHDGAKARTQEPERGTDGGEHQRDRDHHEGAEQVGVVVVARQPEAGVGMAAPVGQIDPEQVGCAGECREEDHPGHEGAKDGVDAVPARGERGEERIGRQQHHDADGLVGDAVAGDGATEQCAGGEQEGKRGMPRRPDAGPHPHSPHGQKPGHDEDEVTQREVEPSPLLRRQRDLHRQQRGPQQDESEPPALDRGPRPLYGLPGQDQAVVGGHLPRMAAARPRRRTAVVSRKVAAQSL